MTPAMIVLVPVLVLGVVLMFGFAGCELDAEGVAGPEIGTVTGGPLNPPPPQRQTPSGAVLGTVEKPYNQAIAGFNHWWRLQDTFAGPLGTQAPVKDEAPQPVRADGYCEPSGPAGAAVHIKSVPISVGSDLNLAAAFDGLGYIEVPYTGPQNPLMNPPQDFTIEAWVHPDIPAIQTAPMTIVSSYQPGGAGGFHLELAVVNGQVSARATLLATPARPAVVALVPGAANGWYYVAMTYTTAGDPSATPPIPPKTLTLYAIWDTPFPVNTAHALNAPYQVENGAPLRIGANEAAPPQHLFKGLMCEVALYSRALNENDVASRFIWGTS